MSNVKHIPELDGLRAIAILAVTAYHVRFVFSGVPRLLANCGWVGVDLFFVLSGFLITGLLLKSKGQPGYYQNFYARRCLRIWPLYFAVLLGAFGWWYLANGGHPGPSPAWPYFAYVQNLALPNFGWRPLVPTWSLAVEEQFYLVWPLVIALAPRRVFKGLLVSILIASPLVRTAVFAATGTWHFVYTDTFCRLDGLALGGLLAVDMMEGALTPHRLRWIGGIAGALGGVAACWLILPTSDESQGSVLLFSMIALSGVGLLALALSGLPVLSRLLTLRPLRFTGKISYGLYLLQFPSFMAAEALARPFIQDLSAQRQHLVLLPIRLSLNFLLAWLSWQYFEAKLLAHKQTFADAVVRHIQMAADRLRAATRIATPVPKVDEA